MRQPLLKDFLIRPSLIFPMLRVLDVFQLCQKGRQIISCDNEVFDMVLNRIVVLTDILLLKNNLVVHKI